MMVNRLSFEGRFLCNHAKIGVRADIFGIIIGMEFREWRGSLEVFIELVFWDYQFFA